MVAFAGDVRWRGRACSGQLRDLRQEVVLRQICGDTLRPHAAAAAAAAAATAGRVYACVYEHAERHWMARHEGTLAHLLLGVRAHTLPERIAVVAAAPAHPLVGSGVRGSGRRILEDHSWVRDKQAVP